MTATARKIAVLFYNVLRHGLDYKDPGADHYESSIYAVRQVSGLRIARRRGRPPRCFLGSLPAHLEKIEREKGADPSAIELWFADIRGSGRRTRSPAVGPSAARAQAPSEQRAASVYIFGAICPKEGKGAALVMPRCDTEAMNLHLAEIATQIALGAHAAILVDEAGWHLSGGLNVPCNISPIALPAKCPELNPQENIWQYMRENWLSNRIFKSFDDIVDHCCDAWHKAHRSALAHHVHRNAPMGPQVLINESW